MIAALLDRLLAGDRNALSRLISIAARGEYLAELRQALRATRPPARVVAFTGNGGVGKSSLLGKLLSLVRSEGSRVAVLACDPESPISGGALLGDRFRMGSSTDEGIYIRSLVALSGHSALADHLDVMVQLLETFRFDVIFLETVGAGQGDVDVRTLVDVVVLLLQPESGDDLQWEKAGILECADIIVVHKADLPTAEHTIAQVRTAVALAHGAHPAVLGASTKLNQGLGELWQAITALPLRRQKVFAGRLLWQEAIKELEVRFHAMEKGADPSLGQLAESWQRGETGTPEMIQELVRLLFQVRPHRE